MTALLFRSGTPFPRAYPEWLEERVAFIDQFRPEGHVARSGALYCAPDKASFQKWHQGNRATKTHVACPHRIWVDDARLMVYPTLPYEQAVRLFDKWKNGLTGNPEKTLAEAKGWAQLYWQSGIPLSEWQNQTAKIDPEQSHWWDLYETLVDPSLIKRRQTIGLKWLKSEDFHTEVVPLTSF